MNMIKQEVSLRDAVANTLDEMSYSNRDIVAVSADLFKSSRLVGFAEHHPDRAFNVGIAEQNMVSFAAGLAHEGFIPYAFSMSPFVSMRACEQCRTDVAYGRVNVRLMGSYSGVSGGISGATHWGLEDAGIMLSMPGMTVIELSDPEETKALLEASVKYDGPIYFRITVEPVGKIYSDNRFEIGKAKIAREGDDGSFICSGITVTYAVQAAEEIAAETGREIRVVDMHTLKPIDTEAIKDAASTGIIVAAQDHNIIGGLGQQVAAVLAEQGFSAVFRNIGIPDRYDAMAHAPFLYHKYGYDREGLKKTMLGLLDERDKL